MLLIDAYRWFIGLIGSIFVITLLQILYQQICAKFERSVLSKSLSKIGQRSLQMYVFSVPFLSEYLTYLFPRILTFLNIPNIFASNVLVYNYVFTFGLAIFYAFVLYRFVTLLEKTKLAKIMFGK